MTKNYSTIESDNISFSEAKKYFVSNLNKMMKRYKFSQTKLVLSLNERCSTLISTEDVKAWVVGDKLPSIYHIFKLSQLFNKKMDFFFHEDISKEVLNVINEKFKFINTKTEDSDININKNLGDLTMNANTTTVTISRKTKISMDKIVRERTTSKNYNPFLASRIYSSGYTLKSIAEVCGVSTRSMRDYSFYGTTLPTEVVTALVKLFKTNARSLGLYLNQDTNRYEHYSVKVTAK